LDEDLKIRTRNFAVRVVKLFSALPRSTEAQILGKQILRSGTSIGAQYRECQYAKSDADFVSKIQGSLQELEETLYWIELLEEMEIFSTERLAPIKQEANELRAIFITIAKKVKGKSV
jgi:four helix bundle protein